jgi:serine/threonine protein kinase
MNHFGSSHPTQIVCRDKPLGRGKIFHDRDIFINHLKKIHPGTPVAKYLTRNHFDVQSTFEEECSFCTCYPFRDWEDRIDHLANHFKANAKANFNESQFSDGNGLVELQNDDLESIVGVKILLSSGLGSPNSGGLTPERSKEEHMMAVKFHCQPSYTAPRKDNDQKNWEIGQSRHDEPRPYLRSETPDSFSRISDPSRAAIATTDQLPAGDMRLRENKLNATTSLNDGRKELSLRTPSEQCRSSNIFIRERPEAGVHTRPLKSLRENLLDARISKDDYNFFIPIDAVERLICEEAIRGELSSISEIDSKWMNSVTFIRNDYQKIFGILTIIKKCHLITTFLQEEIKDIELPIRLQHVSLDDTRLTTPKLESATGRTLHAFQAWSRWETDEFRQAQWLMLAPVFKMSENDIPHLELCDNTVLPFIEDYSADAREGGFSSVSAVRMHPAHQHLIKSQTQQQPLLAVKRLTSQSDKEFSREVEMLKTLNRWKHEHILRLLATYRFRGHYHLIFLYAKHDLRSLWRTVEDPWQNPQYVVWAQKQMRGLAAGLYTIHENRASPVDFSDQHKETSSRDLDDVDRTCDDKWGRHGDLKPDNILWFAEDTSTLPTSGVLQIGDFGLGRFHRRQSRSLVMPGIFCTPTYAAPEVALGQRITRKYDMWSLGCLFLEFCTWLLEGPQGLDTFADTRCFVEAYGLWSDAFYLIRPPEQGKGRTAHLKYAVIRWIERLQHNPRCSGSINVLLALIRDRLLVVDAQQRMTAQELVRIFDREIEKKDSNFTRLEGATLGWAKKSTLRRDGWSEDVHEEPAKRQRLSKVKACRPGSHDQTTSP